MRLASIALLLSLLAALLLIFAGPGARTGLWEFGTGFLLMRWAFYIGLGAAVAAVVFLLIPGTRHGKGAALAAALVVGLTTAWVPWNGLQTARSVPPIHDITTDIGNPPPFVDIAPLRADASNPIEYAGEETAAQQREAYPDIQPVQLPTPPDQAFDQALAAAEAQGWEIVASEPSEGRIEATDTTFWFGFKDDVVIRIVPAGNGSRLDIRSKSRVGRSDVGANSARIRAFVNELRSRTN